MLPQNLQAAVRAERVMALRMSDWVNRRCFPIVEWPLAAAVLGAWGNQPRGRAGVQCAGVRRHAVQPAFESAGRRPCLLEAPRTVCGFHLPLDGPWRAAFRCSGATCRLHYLLDLLHTALTVEYTQRNAGSLCQ